MGRGRQGLSSLLSSSSSKWNSATQKLRQKALDSAALQATRLNSKSGCWNSNEYELDSIVDRCEPNASLLNRTILSGLKSAHAVSQLNVSLGWRQEACKEAARVYAAVGSALAARDEVALRELTTPTCFKSMQKSLNSRKRSHLVHWEVLQLTASVEKVRTGKQRRSAYATSASVDCVASPSSATSSYSSSVLFAQLTCRIDARVIWEVIDASSAGGRLRRHGTGPASAPHELSDTWVLERCISLGGEGQGGEGGLPATSWRLKAKLVEPSGPLEGLPAAAAGTATQGQGAAETVAVGNATATSTATSTAMPARRHTTERASWLLRAERMLRGSALEAMLDLGALLLVSSALGTPYTHLHTQRGVDVRPRIWRHNPPRMWRWLVRLRSSALLALTSMRRSGNGSGLQTETAARRRRGGGGGGASHTGQPPKPATTKTQTTKIVLPPGGSAKGCGARMRRPSVRLLRRQQRASYLRAAALKEVVLERDGHQCAYCGALPRRSRLTIDHVLPRAAGGADEADNLVACCEPCNRSKSSKLLGALETPFTTRMTPRFSAIEVSAIEVLGLRETLKHVWARLQMQLGWNEGKASRRKARVRKAQGKAQGKASTRRGKRSLIH